MTTYQRRLAYYLTSNTANRGGLWGFLSAIGAWVAHRVALPTRNAGLAPEKVVIGPTEAAVLILDGTVEAVLSQTALQTHDWLERLKRLFGYGRCVEVVMVDLTPFDVRFAVHTLRTADGGKLNAELVARLRVEASQAHKLLGLMGSNQLAVAPEGDRDLRAEAASNAQASVKRKLLLVSDVELMLAKAVEGGWLVPTLAQVGPDLRSGMARAQIQAVLMEAILRYMGEFGIVCDKADVLVAATQAELEAGAKQDAEFALRRKQWEAEIRQAEQQLQNEVTALELKGAQELRKLNLFNEQELAELERKGVAAKREFERDQAQQDFLADQVRERERHKLELEKQLTAAQTEVEKRRLELLIERETLAVAKLAQDQQRLHLEQIKRIEREDELARQEAASALEIKRLEAAVKLSPDQLLALKAETTPEAARALAEKFKAEAASAGKQIEVMQTAMTQIAQQATNFGQQLAQVITAKVSPAPIMMPMVGASMAVQVPEQGKRCPRCGAVAAATHKFCGPCGEALA